MTTAAFKKIRTSVFDRAGEECECGCGRYINAAEGHLDHFFGRGAGRPKESIKNCWALTVPCDERKTLSKPSRTFWLERFQAHTKKWGFTDEYLLASAQLLAQQAKGLAPTRVA